MKELKSTFLLFLCFISLHSQDLDEHSWKYDLLNIKTVTIKEVYNGIKGDTFIVEISHYDSNGLLIRKELDYSSNNKSKTSKHYRYNQNRQLIQINVDPGIKSGIISIPPIPSIETITRNDSLGVVSAERFYEAQNQTEFIRFYHKKYTVSSAIKSNYFLPIRAEIQLNGLLYKTQIFEYE